MENDEIKINEYFFKEKINLLSTLNYQLMQIKYLGLKPIRIILSDLYWSWIQKEERRSSYRVPYFYGEESIPEIVKFKNVPIVHWIKRPNKEIFGWYIEIEEEK